MATKPARTRVVQSITKAPDLECHVRVVEVEGVKVVEFRDYIPSLNSYGRGYWVPLRAEDVFSLINGLTEVVKSEDL
jgi:hypothetical protein